VNQLLERVGNDFKDEEARYAYADSVVNAFVSAQIKALREDRDLNQEELATLIGTKQSGVSRLERSDYSAWKIETLRKLARAFGVRLRISFEEFGTIVDEVSGFTSDRLLPRKFENDPAFKTTRRSGQRTRKIRDSNGDANLVVLKRTGRKRRGLGDRHLRKPPRPTYGSRPDVTSSINGVNGKQVMAIEGAALNGR
jgi:transcriptional regulator with XRE-family HTH domain